MAHLISLNWIPIQAEEKLDLNEDNEGKETLFEQHLERAESVLDETSKEKQKTGAKYYIFMDHLVFPKK